MAGESKIAVPDGGTKNVHTYQRLISAVNVEDDVAIVGEPYLPAYSVVTLAAVSLATASDHLMQLMAGAGLNISIRRIHIEQAAVVTAASNAGISLVRLTSAGTGGTVVTAGRLDNGDVVAAATAMLQPTVKGTESTVLDIRGTNLIQTQPVGGTQPPFVEWTWPTNQKGIVIAAGVTNGLVIKNGGGRAGASAIITIEFIERAWL